MSSGPVATATVLVVPNTQGFRAALQAQVNAATAGVTAQVQAQVAGTAAAANAAAVSGVRRGAGAGGASAGRGVQTLTNESNALRGALIGLSRVTPVTVFGLGVYGTAAIAAGYAIKGAIRSTADFEHQLNVFQATTGATAEEMVRVTEKAKALGADLSLPSTSAGDAALAMTELAKAGLTVNDALAGSIGTLQLAAAAQLDVGSAAQFVATELNAFGLAGDQATHIADLLAGASIAAQGDIRDFGTAMQQVSAVSRQVDLSVESTTGALTELALAGLKGADGGTSLRTTLLRLAPTTKQAAQYQKALGIEIDQTKSIGEQLPDLIDQYRAALTALTPVQQQQALAQIFGQDAIRAASILIRGGSQALEENTKAADRNGAAARLAAANAKGLSGAWNGLKSNLDTLGITLGGFVKGPMTDFVTIAGEAVGAVDKLVEGFGKLKTPDALGGSTTDSIAGWARDALLVYPLVKRVYFPEDKAPTYSGVTGKGATFGLTNLTPAINISKAEKAKIQKALKELNESNEQKKKADADITAPNRLRIPLLNAQLKESLQAELSADKAIEGYFQNRLTLAKVGTNRYTKILGALQSAHAASSAVQDQIDANAKQDAAEQKARKDERERLAKEKERLAKEEAREAAQRAKDIFNLQKSRLDLKIQAADLTEPIGDNIRANRAEIRFYNAQIKRIENLRKRRKLTLEEKQAVVDYRSAIIGLRLTIKGLKDDGKNGFTIDELFKEAGDAFKTFGSNIGGRNSVLSPQDERAAFGKDLLAGKKPGTGGGIGESQLTEAQKQTMLLREIADRLRINVPLTKEQRQIADYPANASRAYSRARAAQESGFYS